MKRVLVCIGVFIQASAAAAAMSRVVAINDGRTIAVETSGVLSVVVLRDARVSARDEHTAADYLRRLLLGRWVYIERGEVYRSPDGLHINDALRRRAWLGYAYLGEVGPAPARPAPQRTAPAANERDSTKRKPPRMSAKRRRTR